MDNRLPSLTMRLTRLLLGAALLLAALSGTSSTASAAVCADYSNQAAAQQAADTRDADGDGIYCEALPCPCSSGSGGSDDSGSSTGSDDAERQRQQAAERKRAAAERKRKVAARKRAAAHRRAVARRRAAEHRERVARQRAERGTWRVSRVVDGDTLRVRRTDGSASETVDLIGVDAPEVDECQGPEATALELALTFATPGGPGALVNLETDRSQDLRDDDLHLLAYVDVTGDIPPSADQGGYDLGEQLVAAGFSEASTSGPRFARYGDYHEAQLRASEAAKGAWAACNGEFHLLTA
jgi:endonuclease YncB( thermonuclease family)